MAKNLLQCSSTAVMTGKSSATTLVTLPRCYTVFTEHGMGAFRRYKFLALNLTLLHVHHP